MTKPLIKIHNIDTDEIVEREMNADEYSQYLQDIENNQLKQQEIESTLHSKQAILAKLGITEDEAKLLLG